jgi:hypothetical protein
MFFKKKKQDWSESLQYQERLQRSKHWLERDVPMRRGEAYVVDVIHSNAASTTCAKVRTSRPAQHDGRYAHAYAER